MCLPFLARVETLYICFFILLVPNYFALRLKSEKASNYQKGHKASHRHYGEDNHDNTQASRRTTYRINMPMKVAKLILPQIRNKNQETIIRIYPDKSNEAQNQTGSNYLLSLSYKKLNDEGPQNQVFKDPCPGGCCCCPGMNVDPMSICNPGCPVCPTPCICCSCCSSPPPPPPPPPPEKPPPPTCPMVCLPCCPCFKPCPCRPCLHRPIHRPCYPPCRLPAPPIQGPLHAPCIPAPPVMGPCHPPCLPKLMPPIRPPPEPLPPIIPNRPIVVDHPLRGPPIFIDQCRDSIIECRTFAKMGMCNHPSPFHSIEQIRKICPFSCGICKDYDENAALLRRQTHTLHKLHVPPAIRAKLNRALEQIIRNKALEGNSAVEPQQEKLVTKEQQTGEKKSRNTSTSQTLLSHGGKKKADKENRRGS